MPSRISSARPYFFGPTASVAALSARALSRASAVCASSPGRWAAVHASLTSAVVASEAQRATRVSACRSALADQLALAEKFMEEREFPVEASPESLEAGESAMVQEGLDKADEASTEQISPQKKSLPPIKKKSEKRMVKKTS